MVARNQLLQDLVEGQHPNFDDALPSLMVTLNPRASQRDITESIEEVISEHKRTLGIPETRRREDKYPKYLQVWDLREGWTGEGYDNRREMTLREICQELKISISTAFSCYTKAFEFMTGHAYSSSRWMQIMGLVKFLVLPENGTPVHAGSRPTSDRIAMATQSNDPFAYENQDPTTLPIPPRRRGRGKMNQINFLGVKSESDGPQRRTLEESRPPGAPWRKVLALQPPR